MQLAIVVINYKMEDLTINMVKKELSKISIPHKTIVVNNAATPRSGAYLTEMLHAIYVKDVEVAIDTSDGIFVISSEENLGFARGNNLGASFCIRNFQPEYILFTNNDVLLQDSDVVQCLIRKLQENPNAGVVGPRVVGLDGKCQSPWPYRSFWERQVWMYWSSLFLSASKKRDVFRLDYPEHAQEGFHYYVMGSFFMVRTSDFIKCDMFDPHTFLYAEEPILAERMKSIGKGVYYTTDATVVHAHGTTTKKFSKGKSRDWQFESDCYYYRTYRHVKWPILMLGKFTHWIVGVLK